MESGKYARALYDFDTNQPNELPLRAGDVVRLMKQIDKNWWIGDLNGKTGNFPASFVLPLPLPVLSNNELVCVGMETFRGEQTGDLDFNKGDIIIVTEQIDRSWYKGRCADRVGIFPVNFVRFLNATSHDNVKEAVIMKAKALMDLVPQLDEELPFRAGDMIDILEVKEDGWYMGQCHGVTGMFPPTFVEVVDSNVPKTQQKQCIGSNVNKSRLERCLEVAMEKVSSIDTTDDAAQIPSAQCSQEPGLSCISESQQSPYSPGDISQFRNFHNKRDIFPANDRILDVQSSSSKRNLVDDGVIPKAELERYGSTGLTPYGRALFTFVPVNEDELGFAEGEIVNLIRHVNGDWIEGIIDGRVGIFPKDFVEVIIDCPKDYEEVEKEDASIVSNNLSPSEPKLFPQNSYAKVLYDFKGEVEGDLSVNCGDIVLLVWQLDANWVEAKDCIGRTGICPAAFLEHIDEKSNEKSENLETGIMVIDNYTKQTFDEQKMPDPTAKAKTITFNKRSSLPLKFDFSRKSSSDIDSLVAKNIQSWELDTKDNLSRSMTIDSSNVSPRSKQTNLVRNASIDSSCKESSVHYDSEKSVQEPVEQEKYKEVQMLDDQARIAKAFHLSNVPLKPEKIAPKRPSPPAKRLAKAPARPPRPQTLPYKRFGAQQQPLSPHSARKNLSSSKFYVEFSSSMDSMPSTISESAAKRTKPTSNSTSQVCYTPASQTPHVAPSVIQSRGAKKPTVIRAVARTDANPSLVMQQNITVPSVNVAVQHQQSVTASFSTNKGQQEQDIEPKEQQSKLGSEYESSNAFSAAPVFEKSLSEVSEHDARDKEIIEEVPPILPVCGSSRRALSSPDANLTSTVREPPPYHAPPPYRGSIKKETVDRISLTPSPECISDSTSDSDSCLPIRKAPPVPKQRTSMQVLIQEDTGKELVPVRAAPLPPQAAQRKKLHRRSVKQDEEEKQKNLDKIDAEKKEQEEKEKLILEGKQKMREHRDMVIDELVKTEQEYVHDLHLCYQTFLQYPKDVKQKLVIDVETLFGNLEEVMVVAGQLLSLLEMAQKTNLDKQPIGKCFLDLADDMKSAYGTYCTNHDSAIELLEKYANDDEITEFFNVKVERIREQGCNCFDLGSILIKPVQRILKYPLLLNELFKSTEDGHPDKERITLAINAMTDVASTINEFKRRKDLVFKYRRDTDTITDKVQKINIHSLRKKSARLSTRLSNVFSTSFRTVDETFKEEESRFVGLEKALHQLIKDVSAFNACLNEMLVDQLTVAEDVTDYYGIQYLTTDTIEFKKYHRIVSSQLLQEYKNSVEAKVLDPLNSLAVLCQAGPAKLINKRTDKLLDYDNHRITVDKLERIKDVEKLQQAKVDMETAERVYKALNAQLLEELPKLYHMATTVINNCIGMYVHIRKEFVEKCVSELVTLIHLPLVQQMGGNENYIQTFLARNQSIDDELSSLESLSKTSDLQKRDQSSPSSGSRKGRKTLPHEAKAWGSTDRICTQSDAERQYVQSHYKAEDLYRVIKDYRSYETMDLPVLEGQLLGVIMRKDPMGYEEKWFVDSGSAKGFVLKSILAPLAASGIQAPPSYSAVVSSDAAQYPEMRYVGSHLYPKLSSKTETSKPEALEPASAEQQKPTGYPTSGQSLAADGESTSDESSSRNQSYSSLPEQERFFCYALYPFEPLGENQLKIFERQVLQVLQRHDEDENNEWWLVRSEAGDEGYVPANYVQEYVPSD